MNITWAIVINLDKRVDRLQEIQKHFLINNIDVIRFPAISTNISDNDIALNWNNTLVANLYNVKPSIKQMSEGERGCAMSHLSIWRMLLKHNGRYMFIIEDDIRLVKDFNKLLSFYIQYLPSDWDIFYLDFIHVSNPIRINNFILKGQYMYHTGAYIINKRGVSKILKYLPIDAPLDHFLSKHVYYKNINIYMPNIQLAYQTKSDSDIFHT